MKNSFSESDYVKMIQNLLPQGQLWPRGVNNKLYHFLYGFAIECNKVDLQINKLLLESYPDSADQLISNWETDCGFPNEIFDIPATLADRRAQVLARLTFRGSPTEDFFTNSVSNLGATLSGFDYYDPFEIGTGTVGEEIGAGPWVWTVQLTIFGASASLQTVIEKYFNKLKPAHSIFIYNFI